jgi:hypothetical protein
MKLLIVLFVVFYNILLYSQIDDSYDYSRDALYHPERKPVFLGLNSKLSFEYSNFGFSIINAWWLSNASHLAYYDSNQIEIELSKVGMKLVKFFSKNSTQGFLAVGKNSGMLVFRGTEIDRLEDALTDANVPFITLTGNAKVHRGFLLALEDVWEEVEKSLLQLEKQGIPVWYTGHSLGAALATISAVRKKPAGLYTFGSPLIGNKEFVKLLKEITVHRFVNCTDIVTTIPSTIMGYRHCGNEYFITDEGLILVNPDFRIVFKHKAYCLVTYFPWLDISKVQLRSFADHSIVNYTIGIRKEMNRKFNYK